MTAAAVVGYHDQAAAVRLTQFLGPTEAGSLRAILYTTTLYTNQPIYLCIYYSTDVCILVGKNQSDRTRFSRSFRLLRLENITYNILYVHE